jgi:hypothetical protein
VTHYLGFNAQVIRTLACWKTFKIAGIYRHGITHVSWKHILTNMFYVLVRYFQQNCVMDLQKNIEQVNSVFFEICPFVSVDISQSATYG